LKTFKNKILIIGYGAVSQCFIPLLFKHIDIPYKNVTIMDFLDKQESVSRWTAKGVNYVQEMISEHNFTDILPKFVKSGDMIIDLGWTGAWDIIDWCHDHNVLYLNASVEEWWDINEKKIDEWKEKSAYEKSLYNRYMLIRDVVSQWSKKGPTILVDHGMNPGLISHFVKQGLIDIGKRLIKDNKVSISDSQLIESLIDKEDFADLAMKTGVKVIHCSERDTQISNKPKQVNEFVNTWSVDGFHEEGIGPAELGWGTHEQYIPKNAVIPERGLKNQIFMQEIGINTWVKSFVPPDHSIIGMLIRHGESFTISEKLTVTKNEKVIYRPTVNYAYLPCDAALASLHELRGNNYDLQKKTRIYTDADIISGSDIVGALIMGHPYKSWWTGSDLSIEETRQIIPGQNATTLQVAAGVLAAVMWMIDNPNEGFCLPDDLPHDYILKTAMPYLGNFISQAYNWTPLKNNSEEDVWQFKNFLFNEIDMK
jgi:homospermidine synthase